MVETRVSFVFLLLTIVLFPFMLRDIRAQEQELVRMYMVNPLTGNENFNLSDLQINSVFTIDFYIGNITGLLTWQMDMSYNSSQIHYAKAWFPYDNVFKDAVDNGSTPLTEVANNEDNTTDRGDLLIVMAGTQNPGGSPQYPVNVTSRGLLCKVDFAIVSHPAYTKIDFISTLTPRVYFSLPYYLRNCTTGVDTLNGTYPAGGDPAVIFDATAVPESPTYMLLMIALSITAAFIAASRKKKASHGLGKAPGLGEAWFQS